MQKHLHIPPRPVAVLGVHVSSNGLDFSRSANVGHVGQAFIAEFGDQSPETGKSLHPVGFRVVRVDVKNGGVEEAGEGGMGPIINDKPLPKFPMRCKRFFPTRLALSRQTLIPLS